MSPRPSTGPAGRLPRRLVACVLAVVAFAATLVGAAPAAGAVEPDRVAAFGSARDHGAPAASPLHRLVGVASTLGTGYWVAAADGAVTSHGGAPFSGSAAGSRLRSPIVGMAGDPDGLGYWLVAADGGVFAYDAPFLGSLGGRPLNAPIVGMAARPGGGGYWLVASDGGVFAFGAAAFAGSTGAQRLNAPIVGMGASSRGGYWLAARDGGVFAFGGAPFRGSAGGLRLRSPVAGIATTPSGDGYWLAAGDGGVFSYGDAPFHGAGTASGEPVVAMAATGATGYVLLRSPLPPPPPPPPAPAATGPPLPAGSGSGRRIVYSNPQQRVWLVGADGVVERSYAVSGRRGVPAAGRYSVYSKSATASAGHDGITMANMVRFAHGRSLAIGFHAIPRYPSGRPLQGEDDLGGYRSAGCVRQADADAKRLYDWAPIGTTVVVTY